MLSSHVSVDECPGAVVRTVHRKVKFYVEYADRFYPACSVSHVCEILDELGVEYMYIYMYDGNMLWVFHQHTRGTSKAAKKAFGLVHVWEPKIA